MPIQTGAGSKIFIATTYGTVPADKAAYEALTYVEVEQTESIGEFGDSTAAVTFTGLGDARVQKLKGSSDAGTLNVVMGFNSLADGSPTTGQYLMQLAAANTTGDNYRFKVTFNDASSGSPLGDDTTRYFSGQVGTWVEGVPGADDILRVSAEVRINSPIIRVART
jgi:hypothetical protein